MLTVIASLLKLHPSPSYSTDAVSVPSRLRMRYLSYSCHRGTFCSYLKQFNPNKRRNKAKFFLMLCRSCVAARDGGWRWDWCDVAPNRGHCPPLPLLLICIISCFLFTKSSLLLSVCLCCTEHLCICITSPSDNPCHSMLFNGLQVY